MKPVAQVLSTIPPAFLDRPHAATRYLYLDRKPGRVTCLFQRHPLHSGRPMHLQTFPSHLDSDTAFKRAEDYRIYAATYVLAGTGRVAYLAEDQTHDLRPGSLFQYNGQTMDELRLEPGPGFTECSVSLDGATGRELAALEIWDPSVRVASPGLLATVARAYLDLYGEILDHSRSARSLLARLASLLDYVYSLLGRPNSDERFRAQACSLLAANAGPAFTMREVARQMDTPYDTFRKRFVSLMGVPPIEYQIRRRMEQACLLLQHQGVKQTALALGYTDPFVFSRQFRNCVGVSPKEFRTGKGKGMGRGEVRGRTTGFGLDLNGLAHDQRPILND